MRRRLALFALALLFSGPAVAQSATDSIVSQLQAQGFTRIEVTRTLLGRTRIVAESPRYTREIIFAPNTGAILRDYLEARDDDDDRVPRLVAPDDRDDRDDRDDDREDDRGDDDDRDDDREDDRDDDGDDGRDDDDDDDDDRDDRDDD